MNTKSKRIVLICGLALSMLTLFERANAQLVPYDHFNSCHIDPSKWSGAQNYDPDIRESERRIAGEPGDRHLLLAETAYSSTGDNVGGSGGIFGLNFSNPDAITETSFSVVVTRAEGADCRNNTSPTVIDAEFRGTFFNTEASPTTQIGNVFADIDVERTPEVGDSLTVAGFYSRCDDPFCSMSTLLDYRVLGSVHIGEESRLRIKWEQSNHRFIFQLNDSEEVISSYTLSDTTPAISPYKSIQLARCSSLHQQTSTIHTHECVLPQCLCQSLTEDTAPNAEAA